MIFRTVLTFFIFSAGLFAEEFGIAPNGTNQIRFAASPIERIVKIRTRLAMPPGREGWGGYFLKIEINGKNPTGAMFHFPGAKLLNLSRMPPAAVPVYENASGRFFVKADSDFIAFNASAAGSAFNRTSFMGGQNTLHDRSSLTGLYYDRIFVIKPGGTDVKIALHNSSDRYEIRGSVEIADLPHDRALFSVPVTGKNVMPWSFPEFYELKRNFSLRQTPGEKVWGTVALCNKSASDMNLQWTLQLPPEMKNADFDIRVQKYTYAKDGSPLWEQQRYITGNGRQAAMPGMLGVDTAWQVPPGASGALWIGWRVPENIKSGIYTAKLLFSNGREIPLKLEVLPFSLPPDERVRGLWTNSLPSSDAGRNAAQLQDLREHGINTFFLDGWTVPVGFHKSGEVDIKKFIAALDWLQKEQFNRKILVYGLLGPVTEKISRRAGTTEITSAKWRATATELFGAMYKAADARGFNMFIHSFDEPDIHPSSTRIFADFIKTARSIPGVKIAANVTPAGYMHFGDLIDLAIINGTHDVYNAHSKIGHVNKFYPAWGEASPAKILAKCQYAYSQTRQTTGLHNRLIFGLLLEKSGMNGVWGFAYDWRGSGEDWGVTRFKQEPDGKSSTSVGWEMLLAGVHDCRFFNKWQSVRSNAALPPLPELKSFDIEQLDALRNHMIDEIIKAK